VLVVLAIWVAAAPEEVPGLTIRGSPDAAMSMSPDEGAMPSGDGAMSPEDGGAMK
jgi:hypothetical protein